MIVLSRQFVYWLIAGSKGGANRARSIFSLKENPMNMRQLAEKLDAHYTTIQHHVELLVKNGLLVNTGNGYGTVYFLSQDLEDGFNEFEKIAKRNN